MTSSWRNSLVVNLRRKRCKPRLGKARFSFVSVNHALVHTRGSNRRIEKPGSLETRALPVLVLEPDRCTGISKDGTKRFIYRPLYNLLSQKTTGKFYLPIL